MRVRERDSRASINLENEYVSGPNIGRIAYNIRPTGTVYSKTGSREYIEDVTDGFDGDNPCFHYYEVNSVHPIHIAPWYGGGSPGNILEGTTYGPGGISTDANLNSFRTQHHPDQTPANSRWNIPDWSAELWYDMYPVIKAGLNSINSIYELKDFRMLPSLLNRTVGTASRVYSSLQSERSAALFAKAIGLTRNGLINPFARNGQFYLDDGVVLKNMFRGRKLKSLTLEQIGDTIGKGLKLPADHFLNWKFAVQPLLQDYAALTKAAEGVSTQVDRLLEKADGSIVSSHRARTLDADEVGLVQENHLDSSSGWNSLGSGTYRKMCALTEDPVYRLNVRYSYSFSQEAREFAHALGQCDALGLNANPAILWRATRYSFIADWFVKIGPMLDRLTAHNLEPVVSIHGGCDSVKYKYRAAVEVFPYREFQQANSDPLYVWLGCNCHSIANREVEVYVRKTRIPSLLGIPKTSDFSTMEKLLSLALVASSGYIRVNS